MLDIQNVVNVLFFRRFHGLIGRRVGVVVVHAGDFWPRVLVGLLLQCWEEPDQIQPVLLRMMNPPRRRSARGPFDLATSNRICRGD